PLPPKPAPAPAAAPSAATTLPWDDKTNPDRPPMPEPDATPKGGGKKRERAAGAVMARASGSLLPELSAVTDKGRLSGEESLMRERLAAKVAAMRKLDYFEI